MKTFLTILIRAAILMVGPIIFGILTAGIDPPLFQITVRLSMIFVLCLLIPKVKVK